MTPWYWIRTVVTAWLGHIPPLYLSEAWQREQLRQEQSDGVEGPAWNWEAIKRASTNHKEEQP